MPFLSYSQRTGPLEENHVAVALMCERIAEVVDQQSEKGTQNGNFVCLRISSNRRRSLVT